MRFYFAYLAHESSSFSPIPTDLASFQTVPGGYPLEGCSTTELDADALSDDFALLAEARRRGHDVVVGPMAVATPSRPASRPVYEYLRDAILAGLAAAGPVDGVLLFLHGAQQAEGYDDCEGDLLARIRAQVGPDVPIGVELDLHCNLTDRMVEAATAIVPCKEYPHTDFAPRAAELVDIVEAAASGAVTPVMILRRLPMMGMFHTTRQPMRGLVERLQALEGRDGVLSIGLGHGFGYADIESPTATVLIVADGERPSVIALADALAQDWWAIRQAIVPPALSVAEGLDRAATLAGPVVIADSSDNPGGGAAGDSTHILAAMIARGLTNAVVGMIWDPPAAAQLAKAGVGARLPVRLGGKVGALSGTPLDLEVRVLACETGLKQNVFGGDVPLGLAVAAEADGGLQIVLNTVRQQVIDPVCFTGLGLDPWSKRFVVVKSAQHFHAAFAPHASHVLYVDAPGSVTNHLAHFDYSRLARPVWPLDAPPFERFGRTWS